MEDLRKLRHAVTLADEKSFAQASKVLNLTQPALSRSIQALERSLGFLLFHRHGTGVKSTTPGTVFIERARMLLSHANSLTREADALRDGRGGRVVAGIDPMLTPLLDQWLASTANAQSPTYLHVYVRPIWLLMELVLDDKIDFFIGYTKPAKQIDGLLITPITELSVGYYVRANHPLLALPEVTKEDLLAYPHASLHARDVNRGLADANAGKRTVIICEDVCSMKRATLASDAVLLGMAPGLEPELETGQLVRVPFAISNKWQSQVGVVSIRDQKLSAIALRYIEKMTEILSNY